MESGSLLSSQITIQVFGLVQDILGAVVIVVAGFWAAGRAERWVARRARRSERIDTTLAAFLPGLARYAVVAVALIAAVDLLGIATTGLIAVLGALGLAAGLALQGTLGNVASGVMLLLFRPFKVGDFIDAGGITGTVKAVTLFATEMATPDNVKIVVPNGTVWGGTVKNYGAYGTRRLELRFNIGYEDEINRAMNIIEGVVLADTRAHRKPAPFIAVGELAASSVNLVVQIWCDAGDYGPLGFDLTKAVKEAFDRSGVKIPYPQQVVRHVGGARGIAA